MPPALTSAERRVLGGLILEPGASSEAKTVDAVAERIAMSAVDVRRTLQQLASLDPPLVHREVDEGVGVEFWIPDVRAVEEIEDAAEDA